MFLVEVLRAGVGAYGKRFLQGLFCDYAGRCEVRKVWI